MSEPATVPPPPSAPEKSPASGRTKGRPISRDRTLGGVIWYQIIKYLIGTLGLVIFGWRATGQRNMPRSGGVLLVSNHLSYLDVFFLGIPLRRPLNFVGAVDPLRPGPCLLAEVDGCAFPIQRGDGRLGHEGDACDDSAPAASAPPSSPRGHTQRRRPELSLRSKSGIAVLVARAGVPVVPVGLAGTFEIWPRSRKVPFPHSIRVHYGQPIFPEDMSGMETAAITALIRERLDLCRQGGVARAASRCDPLSPYDGPRPCGQARGLASPSSCRYPWGRRSHKHPGGADRC